MWVFLATDAMGFGGLFIAYAMLRVRAAAWPDPQSRLDILPAALMTFALLASSGTMSMAARCEPGRARRAWLAATLLLGAAFLAGGATEYAHLASGPSPMRLGADLHAATFYAITGYHGLHVLAGVVALAVLLVWSARASRRVLEVAAVYWHFVDLAWMPIFSFLYLVPGR